MKEKKNFFSYKDGCIAFLFVVFGYLMINLIVGGIVFSISGGNKEVLSENWVIYLNSFLVESVFFLAFFISSKMGKTNMFSACRIKTKLNWKAMFICIAISIITFFASINSTSFVNYLLSKIATLPIVNGSVPLANFGEFLLSVLLFAVIPAICEELLFRGLIYNSLRTRFKFKTSLIISSIIFALIHFSIYQTVHQFIIGVILGLFVYFTGSIVYGMVFHFINNFLVLLLGYIGVGDKLIFATFGVGEIALSLLIFLVGAGAVVGLFFLLHSKTKNLREELNLEGNEAVLTFEGEEAFEDESLSKFSLIFSFLVAILMWGINSFGG